MRVSAAGMTSSPPPVRPRTTASWKRSRTSAAAGGRVCGKSAPSFSAAPATLDPLRPAQHPSSAATKRSLRMDAEHSMEGWWVLLACTFTHKPSQLLLPGLAFDDAALDQKVH